VGERWLPIPGYEGSYEVSDHGRVRSLDRWIETRQGRRFKRGVVRRTKTLNSGYQALPLLLDGDQRFFTVHKLVMLAFTGPRPGDDIDICHRDGNRTNNRLSNLRYDTKSANAQDTLEQGRNFQRNKTHCSSGHRFTPDNTGLDKGGRRWCKTCRRAHIRAHYYNNPEYYQRRSELRRKVA
jgi:hypothetical protein